MTAVPDAQAYRCGQPLAPSGFSLNDLSADYVAWKGEYLVDGGAVGELRVVLPDDDDATVSEGVAYGMLLAAYLDDRPSFDGLWRYTKRYHNPRGLMAWKVDRDGRVLDDHAATDADEDMAFALLVAERRWGGYADDARALIDSLRVHAVETGTHLFKPGDVWGGSNVTNPSYFAPAYYKLFAETTGDSTWYLVVDASYALLDRVVDKHSRETGLQPDWVTAAGDSAPGRSGPTDDGWEFDYGYGATRVPWRLAMDAAWNCDSRAMRHLGLLNRFFQGIGVDDIRDGYALDGRRLGDWRSAAYFAPLAAAALVSTEPEYRAGLWAQSIELRDQGYYHDSLRLLGLLLAGGYMPTPAPLSDH